MKSLVAVAFVGWILLLFTITAVAEGNSLGAGSKNDGVPCLLAPRRVSFIFMPLRGGASKAAVLEEEDDEDEDEYGDEEEDEYDTGEEEEEEEEKHTKLASSTLKATSKAQAKKRADAKKAVSAKMAAAAAAAAATASTATTTLSVTKKRKPLKRYIPYIVRACLNPFTVFSMTKAYFASLFNYNYLKKEETVELRSALEEKAKKSSGSKKGRKKMKPGQSKSLSDLPQLSA